MLVSKWKVHVLSVFEECFGWFGGFVGVSVGWGCLLVFCGHFNLRVVGLLWLVVGIKLIKVKLTFVEA